MRTFSYLALVLVGIWRINELDLQSSVKVLATFALVTVVLIIMALERISDTIVFNGDKSRKENEELAAYFVKNLTEIANSKPVDEEIKISDIVCASNVMDGTTMVGIVTKIDSESQKLYIHQAGTNSKAGVCHLPGAKKIAREDIDETVWFNLIYHRKKILSEVKY